MSDSDKKKPSEVLTMQGRPRQTDQGYSEVRCAGCVRYLGRIQRDGRAGVSLYCNHCKCHTSV